MPRDSSGIYTLPPGNPVVDGTIIQAPWANTTLADIVVQLNNVVTRDGLLGTNAPFALTNGTVTQPALYFSTEPQLGMYRSGPGMIDFGVGGAKQFHIETGFAQVRSEFSIATDAASNQDCILSFYRNGALNSSVEANTAYSLALYTYVTAPGTKIGFLPNEIEQLNLDSTGVGFVNVANTLQLTASTAGRATLNIPQGVAPTAPVNGDVWMTSTALFARFNAATRSMAMREAQNTFTAGQKQTMQHNATNAGLRVIGAAGNPSTQTDGDVWYDSTATKLKFRLLTNDKNFVFEGDPLTATTGTFSGLVNFNGGVVFGDAAADPITFISNTATVPAGGFTFSGGPVTFSNGNALNGGTNVGGNLTVTGAAALNGGVTLGDAAADPLTINSINATIPAAGLTFNGGFLGLNRTPPTAQLDVTGNPASTAQVCALVYNTQSNVTASMCAMGTANVSHGPVPASAVMLSTGSGNTPMWIGNWQAGTGAITIMANGAERMRVDTNGFVGIGRFPPTAYLDVSATPAASALVSALVDNRQSSVTASLSALGTTYAGAGIVPTSSVMLATGSGNTPMWLGNWLAGTGYIAFMTNALERMRITPEGNVGMGISVPSNYGAGTNTFTVNATTQSLIDMDVGGVRTASLGAVASSLTFGSITAIPLIFITGATEKARIDAAAPGRVGFNHAIAPTAQFAIGQTAAGNGLLIDSTLDDPSYGVLVQRFSITGGSMLFKVGATVAGSITHASTSTTSYTTTSDRRLKEKVRPVGDVGRIIDNIPVVSFNWKTDGVRCTAGVVAQDLYAVFSEAVVKGDDSPEVIDAWGVDLSKLVPVLVRELQNLRARVAALETL